MKLVERKTKAHQKMKVQKWVLEQVGGGASSMREQDAGLANTALSGRHGQRWSIAADVETEILKEINEKSEAPIYKEVKDMVYTHVSLSETMRLYPPIPIDGKQALKNDVFLDGTVVKKGMRVNYHPYATGGFVSMESMNNFCQLGDELRGQLKTSEDHKWLMVASKLADQTRSKGERRNNLDLSKGLAEIRPRDNFVFQEDNKFECLNFNMLNLDAKMTENVNKSSTRNGMYNMNAVYQKSNGNNVGSMIGSKYSINNLNKELNSINNNNNNNNNNDNTNMSAVDKRFKPCLQLRHSRGMKCLVDTFFYGEIYSCLLINHTHFVGLPPRYRDSVRAITPGLPLFLYNYTTHQLHGIFEAVSFGGSNIDPTAWEDKKCRGESRFPAQVRIRIRKLCKALEEDAFRPVLHHYDGPKFRLELSVPESLRAKPGGKTARLAAQRNSARVGAARRMARVCRTRGAAGSGAANARVWKEADRSRVWRVGGACLTRSARGGAWWRVGLLLGVIQRVNHTRRLPGCFPVRFLY
ncbi:hypothetical protein HYC85_005877 [Camellia sinensis]|uniref:DCD domain-containing protein n=1 Tax=Camellia sinensis TaxID=4442 RepID=A0A7J7I0Q8_CAMSI|nr:hypothetical protein HYC85_005877 [Camellia sinensis]